jgi:hypothetical protein
LEIFGEEECDYDFGLKSDDGSKLERWLDGLPKNQKFNDGAIVDSSKKGVVDFDSGAKNDAANDFFKIKSCKSWLHQKKGATNISKGEI